MNLLNTTENEDRLIESSDDAELCRIVERLDKLLTEANERILELTQENNDLRNEIGEYGDP